MEVAVLSVLATSAASALAQRLAKRGDEPSASLDDASLSASEVDTDALLERLVVTYGTEGATANKAEYGRLVDRLESDPKVPPAGLALDPDRVFQDARTRLTLVFRINLALSLLIAGILIGGIIAGVILASTGNGGLATIFGAVAFADLIVAAVYRPLDQVNASLLNTQRLDMIHLSTRERLQAARAIPDLDKRIEATNAIWEQIKADLASLAGKSA